jgi:hypothetical protein
VTGHEKSHGAGFVRRMLVAAATLGMLLMSIPPAHAQHGDYPARNHWLVGGTGTLRLGVDSAPTSGASAVAGFGNRV